MIGVKKTSTGVENFVNDFGKKCVELIFRQEGGGMSKWTPNLEWARKSYHESTIGWVKRILPDPAFLEMSVDEFLGSEEGRAFCKDARTEIFDSIEQGEASALYVVQKISLPNPSVQKAPKRKTADEDKKRGKEKVYGVLSDAWINAMTVLKRNTFYAIYADDQVGCRGGFVIWSNWRAELLAEPKISPPLSRVLAKRVDLLVRVTLDFLEQAWRRYSDIPVEACEVESEKGGWKLGLRFTWAHDNQAPVPLPLRINGQEERAALKRTYADFVGDEEAEKVK